MNAVGRLMSETCLLTMLYLATSLLAFAPLQGAPTTSAVVSSSSTTSAIVSSSSSSIVCSAIDRRAALGGLLGAAAATVSPLAASAKIESVNPANNYYFPMAKYRYLPRILRAWIACDQLAPVAIEVGDWEGLEEVVRRLDDATTALPLYTNAVEGSRSGKRKKKTDAQKAMIKDLKEYTKAIGELQAAAQKKNAVKATAALAVARANLLEYRQIAQIDGEDGGVIAMPLGNAEEAGHAGAPLGYVVPAFRGGGISMDYALRPGEPMMKNGIINSEYREKYQADDTAAKAKKK